MSATERRIVSTPLPPIALTIGDFARLERLAHFENAVRSVAARQLATELERAVVLPPDDIAPDVVTMNSTVRYVLGPSGETHERALVYPDDYAPTGYHLSILSPLGTALLGLRAGACMPFQDLQGTSFVVTVTAVTYQPERESRRSLHGRDVSSILRFQAKPRCAPTDDNDPVPDNAA